MSTIIESDLQISLLERDFEVIATEGHQGLLTYLQKACGRHLGTDVFPVRFVVKPFEGTSVILDDLL